MTIWALGGFTGAALRGAVAIIGMTACSSMTPDAGSATGPTAPAKEGLGALQGNWVLASLQEKEEAPTSVPAGRFTAAFGSDGDLFIKADCNVCSAAYEAKANGSLEVIGPIPCTLAYCRSAPLDTRYLVHLEAAKSWSLEGGRLELTSPEGALLFEPSQS